MAILKILMPIILILFGIYGATTGQLPAQYFFVTAAIIIAVYLLMGTVWEAYAALKRGKSLAAAKIIRLTFFPGMLNKTSSSIYHLIKGISFFNQNLFIESIESFSKALIVGKLPNFDRAIALLHIATNFHSLNDKEKAKFYLSELKKIKTTNQDIKLRMKKLEEAL